MSASSKPLRWFPRGEFFARTDRPGYFVMYRRKFLGDVSKIAAAKACYVDARSQSESAETARLRKFRALTGSKFDYLPDSVEADVALLTESGTFPTSSGPLYNFAVEGRARSWGGACAFGVV